MLPPSRNLVAVAFLMVGVLASLATPRAGEPFCKSDDDCDGKLCLFGNCVECVKHAQCSSNALCTSNRCTRIVDDGVRVAEGDRVTLFGQPRALVCAETLPKVALTVVDEDPACPAIDTRGHICRELQVSAAEVVFTEYASSEAPRRVTVSEGIDVEWANERARFIVRHVALELEGNLSAPSGRCAP